MFHVDRSAKRMIKLQTRRFSDLGLRERVDLQEWLEGTPEALGAAVSVHVSLNIRFYLADTKILRT